MTLEERDIDRIASRVVQRLSEHGYLTAVGVSGACPDANPTARSRASDSPPARFADARTVAHLLGVDRSWVYEHAKQLGAVRLGGPHGRLRFDLEHLDPTVNTSDERAQHTARRIRRPKRQRVAEHGLLPYRQVR